MKKHWKILPIALALIALIAAGTGIWAWYIIGNRKAQTQDKEIEAPPIIYIRDDNMEEMKTFNLAGLERGTEYSFVFCVMPAKKGTAVNFQLAVAYTGNLGMNIHLFPVDEVCSSAPSGDYLERELEDKMAGETRSFYFSYDKDYVNLWKTPIIKKADGKNDKEVGQNPNDGTRKTYTDLNFASSGPENPSNYLEELNDQRNYRFFIMNITWEEASSNTSIYEKEVDIIYIIANGKPASREE